MGEVIFDMKMNEILSFIIEDYQQGFFMEINIFEEITFIDIACNGDTLQLCYQGLNNSGFSFYNPYFTNQMQIIYTNKPDALKEKTGSLTFNELKQKMVEDQINNLIISRTEGSEQSRTSTSYYGLVHNVAHPEDHDWITDQDDGIPKFMKYSLISTVIAYISPTEVQMKSDLSFYNTCRFRYEQPVYIRFVLAYAPFCHGRSSDSSWLMEDDYNRLYGYEVEDLWGVYEDGIYTNSIYPEDMIVLASSCWGLADEYMADIEARKGEERKRR